MVRVSREDCVQVAQRFGSFAVSKVDTRLGKLPIRIGFVLRLVREFVVEFSCRRGHLEWNSSPCKRCGDSVRQSDLGIVARCRWLRKFELLGTPGCIWRVGTQQRRTTADPRLGQRRHHLLHIAPGTDVLRWHEALDDLARSILIATPVIEVGEETVGVCKLVVASPGAVHVGEQLEVCGLIGRYLDGALCKGLSLLGEVTIQKVAAHENECGRTLGLDLQNPLQHRRSGLSRPLPLEFCVRTLVLGDRLLVQVLLVQQIGDLDSTRRIARIETRHPAQQFKGVVFLAFSVQTVCGGLERLDRFRVEPHALVEFG